MPLGRSRSGFPSWVAAVVLTVLLTACDAGPAPMTLPPTAEPIPEPIPTVSQTTQDAEQVAFLYYSALGHQEYGVARGLLSPELQARTSEAELEASVAGTEAVGLVVIIPMSITPARIIFQCIVSARTIPGAPSEWTFRENTRYLELARSAAGWHITRVSKEPIPV